MNNKYKKILLAIPYFILYIFYVILTINERNQYMMGEEKGMNCVGEKDVSWFVPGSTTEYYFDPKSKPTRNYITWKEFWKARGY